MTNKPTLSQSEIDAVAAADKIVAVPGIWIAEDGHGRRLFTTGGEASFRALFEEAVRIMREEKAKKSAPPAPVNPKSPAAPPQTPPKAPSTAVSPAPAKQPPSKAIKAPANPYREGTQTFQAFALLSDGDWHTWEEFRAINPKYPKDPAGFLTKDGPKLGWTIERRKDGLKIIFGKKP